MPLITERKQVLDVYAATAARGWVLPTFNTENLTTTEAILEAARAYGERTGRLDLPVCVGLTSRYPPRPQAEYYTHTRRWDLGLRLFLADLRALMASESPFGQVGVLVHLDHIQWDADAALLAWDLRPFSSIMFDASTRPLEENIRRTAEFVNGHREQIVIEGACDEIPEAAAHAENILTTPDMAERYFQETGVDLIVANLGTEHRASAATLRYHGELARQITARIGPRLCLHGTSSVPPDQVRRLFDDGVRKVNVWTCLERDSAPALLEDQLRNAAGVAGAARAQQWAREGLLGPRAGVAGESALAHFATTHRQDIVFREMVRIVTGFLELWYV